MRFILQQNRGHLEHSMHLLNGKKTKAITLKLNRLHLEILKREAKARGYSSLSAYIRTRLIAAPPSSAANIKQ